jgi:hypothetical protein
MPRPCGPCQRPDRKLIEGAIAAGTPGVDIAKRFVISVPSLYRHIRHGHVAGVAPSKPRGVFGGLTAVETKRLKQLDAQVPAQEFPAEPQAATAASVVRIERKRMPRTKGAILTACFDQLDEATEQYGNAVLAGDKREIRDWHDRKGTATDRLAKIHGMLRDGASVTVNTTQQVISETYDELPREVLRARLLGIENARKNVTPLVVPSETLESA